MGGVILKIMVFENIFCHSYEYAERKEQFLKLLNESVDICCPQNEIRLLYKENQILIIKNVTKEFQRKTLDYFYKRYRIQNNRVKDDIITWNEKEIQYLKDNYRWGVKKLSEILRKSEYQISCMIGKLKLHKKRRWNVSDDEYIKNNYLLKSDLEIANELNRSLASVKSRRGRLGLILSKI
ncbi:hypothetical protein [Cetobacterium sp.]|uniref:hypothetical protein n=1 Tax=Cetobacterium sp. TaxID=2071632 RepID=UPI003AEF913D